MFLDNYTSMALFYAPADKQYMAHPSGRKLESHTKIPVNRRFPRFSVASSPCGEALEGRMFLCFFLYAKESKVECFIISKKQTVSFEREKIENQL